MDDELKKYGRPMHMQEKADILELTKKYGGRELHCKSWDAEAALRMLLNNLHPKIANKPDELIVYGGQGRAARNWKEFNNIVKALTNLEEDETLCIQSGKPVYIKKTSKNSPRVLIANSNIVPKWATQEQFDEYDKQGLTMYGQMTAGSWIYIGTQGIIQGTYETLAAVAKKEFKTDSLKGKFVLTAGMGAMSGAQPLAATMNEAIILDVEVRPERIEQKVKEKYCDKITYHFGEAVKLIEEAKKEKKTLSIGLVGNAAEVHHMLLKIGLIPDIVTDQTSAHDLLDYVPIGNLKELEELKRKNPQEYKKLSLDTIVQHAEAILKMQKHGAIAIDYGNNLRAQAEKGGLNIRNEKGEFLYPGFVPAYIRPLFCEGKGPFRWAALSGEPEDIYTIDEELLKMFPKDQALQRWVKMAKEKIPIIGLPTRICWLGYGDRAKFGAAINKLVRAGKVKAPVVIGRDHLDCGSVASPHRETEGMKDGSDAISDWVFLNAMLNTTCGASWVSVHHGGGVGIGYSQHAGMVVVADGTKSREKRLKSVLESDPGMGIARHADAGYETAIEIAKKKKVKIPGMTC